MGPFFQGIGLRSADHIYILGLKVVVRGPSERTLPLGNSVMSAVLQGRLQLQGSQVPTTATVEDITSQVSTLTTNPTPDPTKAKSFASRVMFGKIVADKELHPPI